MKRILTIWNLLASAQKFPFLLALASLLSEASLLDSFQPVRIENTNDFDVAVTADYYPTNRADKTVMDVVLCPGDYYERREGCNGFVYKGYGNMPDSASNEMSRAKIPTCIKEDAEETLFFEAVKNGTIPDSWTRDKSESYDFLKNRYANLVKKTLNTNQFEDRKRKIIESAFRIHSITNIHKDSLKTLSKPDFDTDGDGLSNLDEFRCDSNPIVKNSVVCGPKYLEVVPGSGEWTTGSFFVANLTGTNCFCCLVPDTRNKYRPSMVFNQKYLAGTGKYDAKLLKIPPKEKVKVDLIFKTSNLTYKLGHPFEIECYSRLDPMDRGICYGIVEPWLNAEPKQELKPVVLAGPGNGEKYEYGGDGEIEFRWKDSEADEIEDEITYMFQLRRSGGGNIDYGGSDMVKFVSEDSYKINWKLEPGCYVWRVGKQTDYKAPVVSEWRWFAVGQEIKPEKEKREHSQDSWYSYSNIGYILEATAKKPCHLALDVPAKASNYVARFVRDLPSGLSLVSGGQYEDDRGGHGFYVGNMVAGTPERAGIYTNDLCLAFHGNVMTSRYVFVIHGNGVKIADRSLWHPLEKTVVHDCLKGRKFTYSANMLHDAIAGKEDAIREDSEICWKEPLPKGLAGARRGKEYVLEGVPEESGKFENWLQVKNGARESAIRHLFRIGDNGEPEPLVGIEYLNRPDCSDFWRVSREKWFEGKVVHRTFVDSTRRYYFAWDGRPRLWLSFRNCRQPDSARFLDKNPKCLGVCVNEGEYFEFSPKVEGVYSNMLVTVFGDTVITNLHIFDVQK